MSARGAACRSDTSAPADPGALQTLVLTTRGRRSGVKRSTPVLYLEYGETYVVVGSNFGRERHPEWTANLLADPDAEVQIRDRRMAVRARRLTEDELSQMWRRLLELYPTWEAYTHRTNRSFRAFALERLR